MQSIPPERPVLIVMNGYKAQFSHRTINYASENTVMLHAIPVHTSYFLQPLDVSVFKHFKRDLDKETDVYQKTTNTMINKYDDKQK